jgi:hypothetical protein
MVASPSDDRLAVGRGFVAALAHRAWPELAAFFDSAVQFRALIPHGLRSAHNREGAANYLQKWFGDADSLVLLSSQVELIQDRLHITYRIHEHEDQWYIVEQHAFCTIDDGHIKFMDLLCSGFRPEASQDAT